jgi:hypothetical protein
VIEGSGASVETYDLAMFADKIFNSRRTDLPGHHFFEKDFALAVIHRISPLDLIGVYQDSGTAGGVLCLARQPHCEAFAMDDKDRADLLMKLADFRMERIKSRRDHEWKVTVALWALLAAGIAKPLTLTRLSPGILIITLAIVIVGHGTLWVWPHWKRSKEDTLLSFHYANNAEKLEGIENIRQCKNALTSETFLTKLRWYKMFCDLKCDGQIATTIFLSFGVCIRVSLY